MTDVPHQPIRRRALLAAGGAAAATAAVATTPSPATAARVHEERLRQLCREGQAVDTPSRYGRGSSSARFVVRRK